MFTLAAAICGICFAKDTVANVNVLFAFIAPLPSIYVLSFLSTLSTRGANLRSRTAASRSSTSGVTPGPRSAQIVFVQEQKVMSERMSSTNYEQGVVGRIEDWSSRVGAGFPSPSLSKDAPSPAFELMPV